MEPLRTKKKTDFANVRPGEEHYISGQWGLGSPMGNWFKQSRALQVALEGAGLLQKQAARTGAMSNVAGSSAP